MKRAIDGVGKPKGLGDRIAAAISRTGVKKCGGCAKRQEKLNRFGERLKAAITSVFRWK